MKPITINPLWLIPVVAGYVLVLVLYFRRKQVRQSFVAWLKDFGEVMNGWVNNLRQSNAKAVVTLVLYAITAVTWAFATLDAVKIDPVIFPMWLAFLAGLGGFSLAQFKNERATDYGAMERQAAIEAAKASGTVVNSAATTVTGAPVKVEAPAEVKQ